MTITWSATKKEDKVEYLCNCGSFMYDNTISKTSLKAPDLKCSNKSCTLGQRGQPNAVWLTQEEKTKLCVSGEVVLKTFNTQATQTAQTSNDFVPKGMYGRWALELTLKSIKPDESQDSIVSTFSSYLIKLNTIINGKTAAINITPKTQVDSTPIVEEKPIIEEELQITDDIVSELGL